MLRILGGEFRSRTLRPPPDGETTRPYLGRVRESVFSMLHGWFDGASVLDLFAGVGSMGLEAVSRGAASVLMVEQDRRIFELLRANVEALGCADRAVAMFADALGNACLLRAARPVQVVFVDPPYALMRDPARRRRVLDQVRRCGEIMEPRGFLVLRGPEGPEQVELAVPGFDGPEPHRYGTNQWVMLYQAEGTKGPRDEGTEGDEGEEPCA